MSARSGRVGKGSSAPERPGRPQYKPEVDRGESYPLLAQVNAESWLGQRLLEHGCDVYRYGPETDSYRERLRQTILDNGMGAVIVGRHDGKPETYAQTFERLYGEPLKAKSTKAKPA
jgi:hypothetical protein